MAIGMSEEFIRNSKLRILRERLGLTQEEVGRMIGVQKAARVLARVWAGSNTS